MSGAVHLCPLAPGGGKELGDLAGGGGGGVCFEGKALTLIGLRPHCY